MQAEAFWVCAPAGLSDVTPEILFGFCNYTETLSSADRMLGAVLSSQMELSHFIITKAQWNKSCYYFQFTDVTFEA